MRLSDLPVGDTAVLATALDAAGLFAGARVTVWTARRTFLIIDADGARFALSRALAREVMVKSLSFPVATR